MNDCPYFHGSAIYYGAGNRPSSYYKILEIGLQNDILSQLQLKEPQHRQNFRALRIWISCLLDWSYTNIFTNISWNLEAPLVHMKVKISRHLLLRHKILNVILQDTKIHGSTYIVLTKLSTASRDKHLLFCQGSNIIYER